LISFLLGLLSYDFTPAGFRFYHICAGQFGYQIKKFVCTLLSLTQSKAIASQSFEATLEAKKATETTLEAKEATEATLEAKEATEATLETKQATEATLEAKEATEATLETKQATEATLEAKQTTTTKPPRAFVFREQALQNTSPKAFLLSGMSGTGKSYFFQALTRETKCLGIRASVNFAKTAISESKFFQPCIVFLDNIDSIARKREFSNQGNPNFGFAPKSVGSTTPLRGEHTHISSPFTGKETLEFVQKQKNILIEQTDSNVLVEEKEIFDVEKIHLIPSSLRQVRFGQKSIRSHNEPVRLPTRNSLRDQSNKNTEKEKNTTRFVPLLSLLVSLDGSVRNSNSNILIGSTFCADNLDPALLRPGRFDMILHFSYPEKNDRIQILKLQAAVQPWTILSPLISWNFLSTLTKSFSPADLNVIIQNRSQEKYALSLIAKGSKEKNDSLASGAKLSSNASGPSRECALHADGKRKEPWREHTMLSLLTNLCFFMERKRF